MSNYTPEQIAQYLNLAKHFIACNIDAGVPHGRDTDANRRALVSIIEQQRDRITALEASLKSIGDQAEECGDPANPAFFDLVSLIVDEIDKHKENPT